MSYLFLRDDKQQVGPVPASGLHGELLAEMTMGALALVTLIERERSGVYDGHGHGFLVQFRIRCWMRPRNSSTSWNSVRARCTMLVSDDTARRRRRAQDTARWRSTRSPPRSPSCTS